ncbi:MAG: pro-sigmaK processing inhibitor BofA family protein [Candidatus Diapherotrites archaeon]|nr:pro-sigmaK processing inhibitor BofA family protein [Candidatus Diapherotrites archaeon]
MNGKGNTANKYAGPLITLLLLVLLVFSVMTFGRFLFSMLINSVIGVALLIILNFLPFIEVNINVWSILIVALGGIPGVIILVILDLAGVKV